jgi:thiosulfate dehydrogenase
LPKFLAGFVIGIVVLPILFFYYCQSGSAPVATSALPMPFERSLARMALHSRIEKEMPKTVPVSADETNLAEGVKIYREHCAFCHGLPGQDPNAAAKGMFPKPPQLFVKKGVTDDPPGETYWKVANGVRLTGMPGYDRDLSTEQMWRVTLLLANADKLSPSIRGALKP